MSAPPGPSPGTLFFNAIRKHPLVVLLALVAGAAAAYLAVDRRELSYEATAQMVVTPMDQSNDAYTGLDVIINSGDPTRTMQTAAELVESPSAAGRAARELGGDWTAGAVAGAVAVQPLGESNILAVTATTAAPDEAAAVADAYADAVVEVRGETLLRGIERRLAQYRQQLRQTPEDQYATIDKLSDHVVELTSIRAERRDPTVSLARSAASATAVGTPSGLIIALATLAGLILGSLAALALELNNRRLRDENEVVETYPLPVLSRIPRAPTGGRRAAAFTPSIVPAAVREAFRTLAAQLESRSGEPKVLLVTSGSARDGKTTVSACLAAALGESGSSVIAIDVDLRRPQLGTALGVGSGPGLAPLLDGRMSLEEALVPCPDSPDVRVLRAAPQDAGMLETFIRRLPALLEEATRLADHVVLDTPPLGEVGDALRVVPRVDDVLLVARPGHTHRGRFAVTCDLLERAHARPVGLVLVGQAVPAGGDYYGSAAVGRLAVKA